MQSKYVPYRCCKMIGSPNFYFYFYRNKFSATMADVALQWRYNGRDSVSNHQPHDCLLNGLFRRRSKKTWKLRVTPGEFPAQMASNAENVFIWWWHHETSRCSVGWLRTCTIPTVACVRLQTKPKLRCAACHSIGWKTSRIAMLELARDLTALNEKIVSTWWLS